MPVSPMPRSIYPGCKRRMASLQRVWYYISGHSFGHASRSIAVIRQILRISSTVHIPVKTGCPLTFVRMSLPDPRVTVEHVPDDPGVVLVPQSMQVDVTRTRAAVETWRTPSMFQVSP